MRIVAHGVSNHSTHFGVSTTFRSRLIGQHLSGASRDLATLTFDLGGHGACRWCGSLCSVCVPSLKFVRVSVRKILRIYCVSINRPGDLDLWPFDLHGLLVWWASCRPFRSRVKSRYGTGHTDNGWSLFYNAPTSGAGHIINGCMQRKVKGIEFSYWYSCDIVHSVSVYLQYRLARST